MVRRIYCNWCAVQITIGTALYSMRETNSVGGCLPLKVSETVTKTRVDNAVHAEAHFGEETEMSLAKLCADEGDMEGWQPSLFLQFQF